MFSMNKPVKTRRTGYINRKGRDYKVIRDEKGRFKALIYVSSEYIRVKEGRKEQVKFIKQKYRFGKKLQDYKIKPMRTFSKKGLIEERRMTNITERVYSRPIKNKRGKLEVYFRFIKYTPRKIVIQGAYSSLGILDNNTFRKHFNECYKKALAQIDFSPDNVEIKSIRYLYWFNRKTDKLYQRRRRIYG